MTVFTEHVPPSPSSWHGCEETRIRYTALVSFFFLFLIVSPHSQSPTHTEYLTDKSFTRLQIRRHSALSLTSHASWCVRSLGLHTGQTPAARDIVILTKGRLAVGRLEHGCYCPDAVHQAGSPGGWGRATHRQGFKATCALRKPCV